MISRPVLHDLRTMSEEVGSGQGQRLSRVPIRGCSTLSMEGSRGGPWRGYAVLRVVKFAIATGLGFLVAEGIIVLGVFALYDTIAVPSVSSSPTILGLDALALGIGSTAAFLVNERVTVANPGSRTGASWIGRWARYQLAKLLGNVLIVVIQLVLFLTVSLSPVYGSIVGAILSYPVTYAVAMVFVWKVSPVRE
jgi:putative flippase GtrA